MSFSTACLTVCKTSRNITEDNEKQCKRINFRLSMQILPIDRHVNKTFDTTVMKNFFLSRCDIENIVKCKSSTVLSTVDLNEFVRTNNFLRSFVRRTTSELSFSQCKTARSFFSNSRLFIGRTLKKKVHRKKMKNVEIFRLTER